MNGCFAEVAQVQVYQGELYAAGSFTANSSAGNYIQKWGGSSWEDVGGGVLGIGGGNGQISDMAIGDDKLVVAGKFWTAGGVPAHNIAVRDGNEWCGTNHVFTGGGATAVASFDGQLIAAGGFSGLDSVPCCAQVAQWPASTYGDSCGSIVGLRANL